MLNDNVKRGRVERSLQKHAKCLDGIEAGIEVMEVSETEGILGDYKEDMDE